MISVNNISKSFGNTHVLKGISFSIGTGEIVGLLGPNGAGKTTTMRILTGFLSPDKGEVLINELSILDSSKKVQQLIGYLPESNPLYKEMLVADFLNYSADLKQIPFLERRESFDFAVKSTGISDVFYRPIGELSKGYKQRVGLAAALLHKPEILILDEPSEGLDPNQRGDIRKLIKSLSKDHTILISTHVMQEVEALCDRAIVINKGEIVADSSVKELSKGLKKDRILEIELEGKAIKSNLKKLEVKNIRMEDVKKDYVRITLVLENDEEIQPKLAKLVKKNDWIIWKLNETHPHLEDIFYKLTLGDEND